MNSKTQRSAMAEVHILAFPFHIPGHINSLMHMCNRLADVEPSFKLTYVSSESCKEAALRARAFASAEEKVDIVSLPVPLSNALEDGKLQEPLEQLIAEFRDKGRPVECIVTDTFNAFVQDVADKFCIPRASLWTASALSDIHHFCLPDLIARGVAPVTPENLTRELITVHPGIPPMQAKELPLSFRPDHAFFHSTICDGSKRFLESAYALSNTFEELEPHAIQAFREKIKSNYYPVGPCLSPAFFSDDNTELLHALSGEDAKCMSWLDTQQGGSVLYVSFGSAATITAEQFRELAVGLEESQQPFLLVFRDKLISSVGNGNTFDSSSVDGAGSLADFLQGFKLRTSDRGLVVSWAPQMLVLLHAAVGGFLTHCGWNSTTESICAGVPMIAWPLIAEQNTNCQEIVYNWKIGLEVNDREEDDPFAKKVVSRGVISGLVQKLMTSEDGKMMKERAAKLREHARNAVAKGGSSYRNLQVFAKAIKDNVTH